MFLVLLVVVAVSSIETLAMGCWSVREGQFVAIERHSLTGHSFLSDTGVSQFVCSVLCFRHSSCLSFNYDGTNEICQLNNAKREEFPTSFRQDDDFSYFARSDEIANKLCTEPDPARTNTTEVSKKEEVAHPTICQCCASLGMESGAILDSQISAWNVYDNDYERYGPANARFNSNSSWCGIGNSRAVIQVDVGQEVDLYAIVIQRRYSTTMNVVHFKLSYSQNGTTWADVKKEHGGDEPFHSTNSATEDVTVRVHTASQNMIHARFIRIHVTGWTSIPDIPCMRFELIGCTG